MGVGGGVVCVYVRMVVGGCGRGWESPSPMSSSTPIIPNLSKCSFLRTYTSILLTPPEGTVWSCSPGSTTSQRQGESKQTRFQQTSSLYVNLSEV